MVALSMDLYYKWRLLCLVLKTKPVILAIAIRMLKFDRMFSPKMSHPLCESAGATTVDWNTNIYLESVNPSDLLFGRLTG